MANIFNKYAMRRESLISPWGVGAIVPFPHDESLMTAGIDYWFNEDHPLDEVFYIIDERLSKRLGGKLFVWPPDYRERSQDREHADMKIPAVRFPLWHYCPVCGNMEKVGINGGRMYCSGEKRKKSGKDTYCSKNKGKRGAMLVPERFIAVCEDGHIEDFPYMEWVHAKDNNKPILPACKLVRSTGGSTSALSGVRYTCTCGATATMFGAFNWNTANQHGALDDIGYSCTGNTPWLDDSAKKPCGKSLRVLQRGASNVWFADIISSVYIPWIPKYKNQNTKECINKGIKRFRSARINGQIDDESIRAFVYKCQGIDDDIDVKEAIAEIFATLNNLPEHEDAQTEDEYRQQEFDVLRTTVGNPDNELHCVRYDGNQYERLPYIDGISLVHKLRETRVFKGFRRITPDNQVIAPISADKTLPWYPAVKNSGEGIMFEFNTEKLKAWAAKKNVKDRVKIIEQNLRNSDKLTDEEINPIYILLHTFAHCLITTLSNECGYSNASIREKIYSGKYLADASDMAGILIYTASGDSEGSLGGLVRQGLPKRIENVIKRAINEARWCTADPVCIQGTGQGQNGCNLAACHNCALLPETSCENKNMLLDRGLMIGTLNDKDIGFFNEYEQI